MSNKAPQCDGRTGTEDRRACLSGSRSSWRKSIYVLEDTANHPKECGVTEISLTNVLRELRRPGLGEPRRLSRAGTRTGSIQLRSARDGRGAASFSRGTAANTETVNLDDTISISPTFVHSVSVAFNKTHCYRTTNC